MTEYNRKKHRMVGGGGHCAEVRDVVCPASIASMWTISLPSPLDDKIAQNINVARDVGKRKSNTLKSNSKIVYFSVKGFCYLKY